MERRDQVIRLVNFDNHEYGRNFMNKTKPFYIPKTSVMDAWRKVRENKGSFGIDEESVLDFEINLKSNLYKIWNRLSSGSYFPPPVMAVEIPKADGSIRTLGIPTDSDRVAQTVVKDYLEALVEPKFHEDSYAYRPRKSALDAVEVARKRCWRHDWCIDLDIKGFFDNLDHELMMKAVRFHTKEKWVHLYVERWLKAPIQNMDGQLIQRTCGTPQGGVISPLLANIFMHHAFDGWMKRHYPWVRFERYADDVIVHCKTLRIAERILNVVRSRLKDCGLELHPTKTKLVYCKDEDRSGSYEHESFDFLGFTFRPRRSKNKRGKYFVNFSPAISNQAAKRIRKTIRSWKLHLRSDKELADLAYMFNATVTGWVNYYGRFYKSAMYFSLKSIERFLIRWATRKYKRLRGHDRRAKKWLRQLRNREPGLFVHWRLGLGS